MSDSPYAPLRHPAFRAFLVGRVLAALGSQSLGVAVGWQMYALTGDPLDLGLIGLVQFLPPFLLFPLVGIVVDRTNRSRVLTGCYLGLALGAATLLGLTLSGELSAGRMYAALFLVALARMFSGPSATALLPQIVPTDEYPRATSWSSSAFTAAFMTGPALGGAVYGLAQARQVDGAAVVYGLAGVLFLGASPVPGLGPSGGAFVSLGDHLELTVDAGYRRFFTAAPVVHDVFLLGLSVRALL